MKKNWRAWLVMVALAVVPPAVGRAVVPAGGDRPGDRARASAAPQAWDGARPAADDVDLEWDGPGPGGMRFPGVPVRMMEYLKLTADQRQKLEEVRDRQMRKAIRARADLQIAKLDLRALMRSESPDGRAIDAQIDKIAGLRASLRKSQVAAMLEARAVLTPEQPKQWRETTGRGPLIKRRVDVVREMREGRGS